MEMREKNAWEDVGDDCGMGPAGSILCIAACAGAVYVLKKISDAAAQERGEEPKSWKNWLLGRAA